MVHRGRRKSRKIFVAGVAGCSSRQVGGRFTEGIGAIVASGTVATADRDAWVIEGGRFPSSRAVTVIAG